MQIIHPSFFLASTCIICALISVMTGSSWTTIATIGIALMGIGKAQGFEDGWIAGAIISGAYFGIKYLLYPKPLSWRLPSQTLPVPSHPLYDDYYGTVSCHHADYFHSGRILP